MKQVHFPVPSGWSLFFRACYRRLQEQFNSPWTKLTVLLALLLIVSRNEFSFSISIDGPSFLGVNERSVFYDLPGGDQDPQLAAPSVLLTSYTPAKKNWTAKQLQQLDYVRKYRLIALEEKVKSGIPASITMAQGLLESGTGRSSLATKNNNHFGIKCFSKKCAKGHCSNHNDDHHKDFFRVYKDPEESFRDHSNVLKKDRYRKLFDLSPTDYEGWARGLSKAGYATDPRYADKLIRMIEDLELYRLDE